MADNTSSSPSAASRRVVITGFGATTCIGSNAKETWESMREGRCGLSVYDNEPFIRYADNWQTTIGGQVRDLSLEGVLEHREAKRLDRVTQLGMAAAAEAITHSGIDFAKERSNRCGVVIGTGIGGIETIEQAVNTLRDRGPTRLNVFTVPRLMANATTGAVSIHYGLEGPASCHATACASAGHAFGDAMAYIRSGMCDVMITGGAEAALTPLCLAAFGVMKAMSTRNDAPEKASRPFDQNRDGFVLAEGASVFVLESLEHAQARGATIYAELVGFGNSSDAHHITAPHAEGAGAARSMKWALEDAGLETTDIDYINAHGTSTPLGDEAELKGVMEVFGDHAKKTSERHLLMSSTKSVHGHALGASGAVEMIACLHAVRDGVVPPTINLDNPIEGCEVDLVAHESRERPVKYALNNTFGFGGHNTSLILKRFED
ncbi:MAG: beta-ketoacyl-ACP synthase II [Planctomycetota bacterium]